MPTRLSGRIAAVVLLAATRIVAAQEPVAPPRDHATPQAFGAKGDGVADDTGPLARALSSGHAVWCDGRFRITAPIVTTTPLGGVYALMGGGRQACVIVLATPTARLEADIAGTPAGDNSSHGTPEIVLHDLSFMPTAAITGHPRPNENAAFSAVFATTGDATSGRIDIRNVAVMPNAATAWAQFGLYLERARTAVIDSIRCEGAQAYFYDAGSACVYIHGAPEHPASGADIPAAIWIRHLAAYNNQYGVRTDDHVEGLILEDSEIVGGQVGVRIDDTGTAASTLFQASHDEVDVTDAGFDIADDVRLQIHDNHIFLSTLQDDGQDAFCIRLTSRTPTLFAQIHDNLCEGYGRVVTGAHHRIGVSIDSAGPMTAQRAFSAIHDNIFSQVDLGIALGTTVNNVLIGCNQYLPDGTKPLVEIDDRSAARSPGYANGTTCVTMPTAPGSR